MNSRARRDDGLRRVSSVTRWVAGSAIVLGGVLTAVVAKALPGKASAAAPSAPAVSGSDQGATSLDNPSTQSSSDGSLAPPPVLPEPSRGGGSVVSGGS